MYKSGIITSEGMQKLHEKVVSLAQVSSKNKAKLSKAHGVGVTDVPLHKRGIEWQQLNHSITILGWGTDPQSGQKYWIIRNSYGPNWGDHGDLLAERGTDFMALEGQSNTFSPVLCSDVGC